jgi:transcriptional regulator with XRE-family HTH domain
MANESPTVRQRELAKRLGDTRSRSGLTAEDVAEKLRCSAAEIIGLEAGERTPSLEEIRNLCVVYRVEDAALADLVTLVREAQTRGWWIKYEDINLNPYLGLEQTAAEITSYTMYCVPALLQTESYAREIIKAIAPKMHPDIYQQRIEVRLRRQQLLDSDNGPRYHALMDEAVLRRPVGGPKMMVAQLDKLIKAARSGRATFQVIPLDIGAHAAQDSNFTLFEFAESSGLSPVAFVEGLTCNQYVEDPGDVSRYREAIGYLREAALSPDGSVQLATEIQRALAREELTSLTLHNPFSSGQRGRITSSSSDRRLRPDRHGLPVGLQSAGGADAEVGHPEGPGPQFDAGGQHHDDLDGTAQVDDVGYPPPAEVDGRPVGVRRRWSLADPEGFWRHLPQ